MDLAGGLAKRTQKAVEIACGKCGQGKIANESGRTCADEPWDIAARNN